MAKKQEEKEYLVLIAAQLWARNDKEACEIAEKYAQYLQCMECYDDNNAGVYRLTDVSGPLKEWRRVIDI